MKYRTIKKLMDRVYTALRGVHYELLKDELVNNLGCFGENSYIETPIKSVTGSNKVFIGNNTYLHSGARLDVYNADSLQTSGIHIGDNCYICYDFTCLCGSEITIEDNVLIASGVCLFGENHGMDPESEMDYMHQDLKPGSISIGKGTWLGEKVMILPNVSIGKKCIIGSGSIVTDSVPDYCIAVGNPARVIKRYSFERGKWENC